MSADRSRIFPQTAAAMHIFLQFLLERRWSIFKTYVCVPLGVVLTMSLLYGVDRLIKNCIKVVFPASVAVMLIISLSCAVWQLAKGPTWIGM